MLKAGNQIDLLIQIIKNDIDGICTFPISIGDNIIGSNQHSCDVYLPFKNISNQHCRIICETENEFYLMDDGSASGVYVEITKNTQNNQQFYAEKCLQKNISPNKSNLKKIKIGVMLRINPKEIFYIADYKCRLIVKDDQNTDNDIKDVQQTQDSMISVFADLQQQNIKNRSQESDQEENKENNEIKQQIRKQEETPKIPKRTLKDLLKKEQINNKCDSDEDDNDEAMANQKKIVKRKNQNVKAQIVNKQNQIVPRQEKEESKQIRKKLNQLKIKDVSNDDDDDDVKKQRLAKEVKAKKLAQSSSKSQRNNISSDQSLIRKETSMNPLTKRNTFRVAFSMFIPYKKDVERLKKLGILIEDNKKIEQLNFNVLVQKEFTRSMKFLIALNIGAKVVSYDWVDGCIVRNRIITDLDDYLLEVDKKSQEEYGFDLKKSIQLRQKAGNGILHGFHVWLQQNIKHKEQGYKEIGLLVKSAGGQIVKNIENLAALSAESCLVIINEKQEKDRTDQIRAKSNARFLYYPEFIFASSCQQKLLIGQYCC